VSRERFTFPNKKGAFRKFPECPFNFFDRLLLYGNVDRGKTFLALLNVESYPVAFIQRFEAGHVDAGMVYKYIVTIFLLDEAVAFCVVKPFYNSISHCCVLLSQILIFLLGVATLTNGYTCGKCLLSASLRPAFTECAHDIDLHLIVKKNIKNMAII
jgi:hypothetical protein